MNDLGIEENVKDIILKDIVCFGSNGYGPNILAIKKLNPKLNLFSKILNKYKIDDNEQYFEVSEKMQKLLGDYKTSSHELFNSILTGFSLACSAGPLCH